MKEAYRLLSCSILKLEKPSVDLEDPDVEDINAGVNRMNIRDEKLVHFLILRINTSARKKRRKNQKA